MFVVQVSGTVLLVFSESFARPSKWDMLQKVSKGCPEQMTESLSAPLDVEEQLLCSGLPPGDCL